MANPNKPPKGLLISGLVCIAIALIGGTIMGVYGLSAIAGFGSDISSAQETAFGDTITISGTGGSHSVWSTSPSSFAASCTATDESGSVDTISSGTTTSSVDSGGDSYDYLGSFDTTSGVDYEVTCSTPSSDFITGNFAVVPLDFAKVGWGAGAFIGSFLLGGVFMFIGIVLLIAGAVSRSNWKKRQSGMGGPPSGQFAPAGTPPPPPAGFGPPSATPTPPQQNWGGPPSAPGGSNTPPPPPPNWGAPG